MRIANGVQTIEVGVSRVRSYGLPVPLPRYETSGAVGMDLIAAISEPVRIGPHATELIPTGIRVAIPPGYEMQIRPRSGLALKHGITVANAPGTIDEDYRGVVGVILLNTREVTFIVKPGDRIAQAVFTPVARAVWVEVDELDPTHRGEGGFGSTDA